MGVTDRFEQYEPRVPVAGSVGAGLSSLVVAGLVTESRLAVVVAGAGVVCLVAGLWRTDRRFVTLGVLAQLCSVIYVGVNRTAGWLLLAAMPVALAWGMASVAVRLGQQIGRTGETLRVELVHGVGTLTALVFAGGYSYVAFRSVTGTQSPLVVAILLGSLVVTVLVLR